MAIRKRLNHVAAGLLGAFCSRYNQLDRYWALGMLYKEVLAQDGQAAPCRVMLDLLEQGATPAGPGAAALAARYADYLRNALAKKNLRMDDLESASVEIAFNADIRDWSPQPDWIGHPYLCTVTLGGAGDQARYAAYGRCLPHDPRLFTQSGRAVATPPGPGSAA